MTGPDLGEVIAGRLAALMKPTLDELTSKTDKILAAIEEISGRLPLIEQHYKSCPQARAKEGTP